MDRTLVTVVMVLVGVVAFSLPTRSDSKPDNIATGSAEVATGVRVLPPDGTVQGKGYKEWSGRFWQWALEYPLDEGHPFLGESEFSHRQRGDVWYWGAPDGPAAFDVALPEGTWLFLTTRDVECSSLEPPESGFHGDSEAEQRDCAKFWADHIRNVFVVINGDAVEGLDAHRFASPQFKFNAPTPWIFAATGGKGSAVADGYYLLIKLPAGVHTIHYGGEFYFAPGELGEEEVVLPKDITLNVHVD
jgi:hypothetical protein